jgi:hypothetical protein
MKSCLHCHTVHGNESLTCINCGEGSWSAATPDVLPDEATTSPQSPQGQRAKDKQDRKNRAKAQSASPPPVEEPVPQDVPPPVDDAPAIEQPEEAPSVEVAASPTAEDAAIDVTADAVTQEP